MLLDLGSSTPEQPFTDERHHIHALRSTVLGAIGQRAVSGREAGLPAATSLRMRPCPAGLRRGGYEARPILNSQVLQRRPRCSSTPSPVPSPRTRRVRKCTRDLQIRLQRLRCFQKGCRNIVPADSRQQTRQKATITCCGDSEGKFDCSDNLHEVYLD